MIWRDIPGWPRYQISESGLVNSKDMEVGAKGNARATRRGRLLLPITKASRYKVVSLTDGSRKEQISVHRLVALTFLGPPPHDGAQVLHWDGTRDNNHFSNLRWGTPADNHGDTLRHGRRKSGEQHPMAKLTWVQVQEIRTSTELPSTLALRFGVTRAHVWAVRRGRSWAEGLPLAVEISEPMARYSKS